MCVSRQTTGNNHYVLHLGEKQPLKLKGDQTGIKPLLLIPACGMWLLGLWRCCMKCFSIVAIEDGRHSSASSHYPELEQKYLALPFVAGVCSVTVRGGWTSHPDEGGGRFMTQPPGGDQVWLNNINAASKVWSFPMFLDENHILLTSYRIDWKWRK